MAIFSVDFKTGNDAFSDGNLAGEITRILRAIAERIDAGNADVERGEAYAIADINGNRIGSFFLDP